MWVTGKPSLRGSATYQNLPQEGLRRHAHYHRQGQDRAHGGLFGPGRTRRRRCQRGLGLACLLGVLVSKEKGQRRLASAGHPWWRCSGQTLGRSSASNGLQLLVAYQIGQQDARRGSLAPLFPRIKQSPYLFFSCPSTYSSVCSMAMFM